MSQTFIVGHEVAFTIDADTVVALTAEEVSVGGGPPSVTKRLFGKSHAINKPGQGEGTFSASGVGTQESLPILAGIRDASSSGDNPIAIVVTYWGSGDTDTFSANCRVTFNARADGDVTWNIEGDIDGDPTYAEVG